MVLTFKIILNIIFTSTEDFAEYNNMITPNIKHTIPQVQRAAALAVRSFMVLNFINFNGK